jgi:PAS domain S-box-containing protein
MMRGEVSFAAEGSLIASTWPEAEREALARQLFNPAGLYADQSQPFEMTVNGETYLSLMGELKDQQGEVQGFHLIQFSLDKAVAFLHTLERVLVAVGLIVLVAGALMSYVGVGRITRPIRALVGGARRIGSGELDHRIGVETRDEVGELAVAFNEMAGDLGKSREALEASERLYRDLFDNAQDAVFTMDMGHGLVTVNRAACAFWGYSEQELTGRNLFELIAPEDAEKLRETERRPEGGPPWPAVEVDVVRKDGTSATLEITSRWILEGGEACGVHAIGRDVTQRREREKATARFRDQLYQAEKLRALGELAAGVAHNFNNLLTGVMGYAELMKLRTDIPEPVQQNAAKIVEAARRCSAIVRRIQAFGRPIDPTQTERVNLNRVIHDTVDITSAKWRSQAEREGRSIQVALDLGDIPEVQSTGAAWEEILTNLIFNAVDAMPEGGTIRIATRQDANTVVAEVSDTGTGMDEETRRRVFEPFFTTKPSDRGTGLGLSTVWGLVQAQGGRVEIDSAPGEGTTFAIRVPQASAPEAEDAEGTAAEPITGMAILVIDDEPSVRDFLPSLLSGHRVDTAEGGLEGLRLFEQKRHDLVITDWVMSGMSGLAVADRVKRLSPRTVVVLMTGWEIKGTAASQSPSVDLVFSKPFDAPKLDAALRQVAQIHADGTSDARRG